MRRMTLAFIIVLVLAVTAYAEMGGMGTMGGSQGQTEPGMKMGEGMKMMCPKMQEMQGGQRMQQCSAVGKDMMQTMMDIMDNQEKIIMGLKPEEKEDMVRNIRQMKGKMQGMMSMCKDMMGSMGQPAPAAAPAPESKEKETPAKTEPMSMPMTH